MKVLVTGGCGFLGSHVCEYYKEMGWDVVAYDNMTKFEVSRLPYGNEIRIRSYNRDFLNGIGVEVVQRDILDPRRLEAASKNCDFIVHTAAQPAMTISLEDPMWDFQINAGGTLSVLGVAKEFGIPVVNCSTIHVYGNGINESLWEGEDRYHRKPSTIDEEHPLLTGKLTPLHASKRAAEIYVQTFIDSYGTRVANFRLTGMYGPRQFGGEDHGWVANFAIRTMLGLPITIFGTDKQVRDVVYVTDVVEAIDRWFTNGQVSGTYNIGGSYGTLISLGKCLQLLSQVLGKDQDISVQPPREGDLLYFVCDIGKAWKDFGWAPKTGLHGGIYKLVDWLRSEESLLRETPTLRGEK